jgi:hypothetical protein
MQAICSLCEAIARLQGNENAAVEGDEASKEKHRLKKNLADWRHDSTSTRAAEIYHTFVCRLTGRNNCGIVRLLLGWRCGETIALAAKDTRWDRYFTEVPRTAHAYGTKHLG